MRASMGDVVMLESMYMNPAWILDFCEVMTNHMIMHLDYLMREVGVPDGVWMYEDMGFTKAPFISPEMQREMIMPFHKRLGDFIHSYNIPWIMHSCGKIRSFLPAIQEAGIDCLQVLEAKAGQDVREFAEATGNKMAFMGNLNIMAFETNDKKKLEEEIVPKLKDIKTKRIPFVFHSDHSVPKTVTVDTYKYALELFNRYKTY
jgi:uroporphyrinogen decarboxylase